MSNITVGPLEIRFLVDGAESSERLSMFECRVPAGAKVPLPHSHDAFEETVYGLAGVSTWTVDGEQRAVSPGEALFIPRGAVHGFVNDAGAETRFLSVITPGVLGPAYFRELADVVGAGGPPDPAAVEAVMRRHGLTVARPANV